MTYSLFVYCPKIVYNCIKQLIWIGHVLRRNWPLKHVTEGKMKGETEVTGRREGTRRQLLDDLKTETRYLKLKEKALEIPL